MLPPLVAGVEVGFGMRRVGNEHVEDDDRRSGANEDPAAIMLAVIDNLEVLLRQKHLFAVDSGKVGGLGNPKSDVARMSVGRTLYTDNAEEICGALFRIGGLLKPNEMVLQLGHLNSKHLDAAWWCVGVAGDS